MSSLEATSVGLPVDSDDVLAAARALRGVAVTTPVLSHPLLDDLAGRPVLCKAENLQHAGSFKFRGAFYAMSRLHSAERARGVIGASSGNHAAALALAGHMLDIPVTVVVPHDAPPVKTLSARRLGATIVTHHRQDEDRDQVVAELAVRRGLTVIPSADHPDIIAGAGTAALELLRQAPGLGVLLVAVGGGGLAAGSALAARHHDPATTVIGVEPQNASDTAESLRAGRIVALPHVPDTIADGLRHTRPAALPWAVNSALLDSVATVSDRQVVQAMRSAFDYLKVVVEPSGAVGLAASAALGPSSEAVGVILSGGSISLAPFVQLLVPVPHQRPGYLD